MEALEELMASFFETFNLTYIDISELFWYGVFCKTETYANYEHWDEAPMTLEIPDVFQAECAKPSDRVEYVNGIINQVIKGEIDKPEWMVYVEMEESCEDYDASPSTFLRLIAKEDKYEYLAEKLLNFLYSVNLITKII